MKAFTVHPKHWWTWLNPFWYRRKKIMEAVIQYEWEHGGEKQVQEKIRRHFLYGDPLA